MSLRDTLPDAAALDRASKYEVLDVNGKKIAFGSIFADQKTVVVFIRHFFCGACKMYVETLLQVPEAVLQDASTKIVIIGCGEYQGIQAYHEMTNFKGSIYADPSRQLYFTLGMDIQNLKVTPANQPKPSYYRMSRLSNLWWSIKTGHMQYPSLIGKTGNNSQLGGDFVFGPGDQCTFAHRMQHTEDHIEAVDLMKAAGVTWE